MKKILVCQHVPFEILGTLDPLIKEAGIRVKYVNFGRDPHQKPDVDEYDGLVILGGPMNVDEVDAHPHLDVEVAMVQEAIKKGIPILGICLGSQIIAKALGAMVYKNSCKEIGWFDVALTEDGLSDPVLSKFKGTQKVFQWHGDTFDIPDGAVWLAKTDTCTNQAFRYGDNVYGFQFHLEVGRALIARWLDQPAYLQEVLELKGQTSVEQIQDETKLYVDGLNALAGETFGALLDVFGVRTCGKQLRSR